MDIDILPTTLLGDAGSSQTTADEGSRWSMTISHYLLERRRQTHSAYHAQLNVSDAPYTEQNTDDWLFTALFSILVQRLEEGHTVLVLTQANNEHQYRDDHHEHIDDYVVTTQSWQQQLLQPLLQPLVAQIDDAGANVTLEELLNQNSLWNSLLLQSALPAYQRQVLDQQYHHSVPFYRYLQSISQNDSHKNSLSDFEIKLSNHPLIRDKSSGDDCPIVFKTKTKHDGKVELSLWLHRTWQAEHALARHIMRIKSQTVEPLPITLNTHLNDEQKDAIHMANQSAFSIITGGPGTGKTYTVAQLVIALQQAQSSHMVQDLSGRANLALAAPTGKAAQRMQESLQRAIEQAGVAIQLPEAKTIHRLLGIGQGGQPRYHADNPLSEDIVIVDEASMLGVELANHLVSAIKPSARLILLGDANQLAAVDAGAVLADLCRMPALQDVHQRLARSRRFSADSGIGQLASLINEDQTNMPAIWSLISRDSSLNFYTLALTEQTATNNQEALIKNSLSNFKFLKKVQDQYSKYINGTKKVLSEKRKAKSIPTSIHIQQFNVLMTVLNTFKVLTAGHHGTCGDHYVNRYLSEKHKEQLKLPLSKSEWYHGRPIMVLQNNYELGLFNGDIGICLQTEQGRLQVFFENKTQGIAVNMLSEDMIATAYAMTIHKSQGSEFDHVAVCFDEQNTRLLSQELIYTAVTRAKSKVSIFSTSRAFTYALKTPTVRQTGLASQFEVYNDIDDPI